MVHVTFVHYTIGTVPHLNHSNLFFNLPIIIHLKAIPAIHVASVHYIAGTTFI